MTENVITPEDKREVLNEVVIGGLSVSEDGTITGYIRKSAKEDINFEELMEESDRVIGKAKLSFQKAKGDHEL